MGIQNYQLTRNNIGEDRENKSESNIWRISWQTLEEQQFFVTSLASKVDTLPDSKGRDLDLEFLSTSVYQRWAKRVGSALNIFEEEQSWCSGLNFISALNDWNFWHSPDKRVRTRKICGPLGILHLLVNENWGMLRDKEDYACGSDTWKATSSYLASPGSRWGTKSQWQLI